MEQLANNPVTTLAANITSGATSLSVTDASAFPGSGDFTIKIGSELLRVTGVSGTTFTVTRGQESTTAASHSSGDTVTQVVTANTVFRLFTEMTQVGGWASRPTTVRSGTEYRASDINLGWRYNGSNWDLYHPFYRPYANRVNLSGWTNLNFVNTTWTDINGVTVAQVTTGTTTGIRGKYHSLPTAPFNAYTIVGPPPIHEAETQTGLVLYDSGTTKAKVFTVQSYNSNTRLCVQNWTTPTSTSSTLTNNAQVAGGYPFMYLRFQDDNTNWNYYCSPDGQNWCKIWKETRNTFLTPTNIGLCLFRNSNPTSYDDYMTYYGYWEA